MKKSIIIATFALGAIVLGTNNVNAQQNTSTTVNIKLNDVIAIGNGSIAAGGIVDFNYITADDYNSDKTVEVPNSLIVTSTKPFNIKVKANEANFTDGVNNIPVNVLTVRSIGNGTGTMRGSRHDVVLSTTDQALVNAAPLGSLLSLRIDYLIPKAESSSSKILGKPAGTYTQKVTYTVTAI